MNTSLTGNYLQVDLSVPECERIAAGEVVGDRKHPLFADAKIDIWPLEEYGGPEFEKVHEWGQAAAQFFSNEDLSLFLPVSALKSTLFSSLKIPKTNIYSFAEESYRQHYLNRLPDAGVRVRLAGSLAVVDLSQVIYED